MNSFGIKIALILLSVVIFTTGMGTTIANFCCETCITNFFSELNNSNSDGSGNSCCSSKHIDEKACKHQNKKDCCKVERHNQILDSYHSKPVIFIPFIWLDSSFTKVTVYNNTDIDNSLFHSHPEYPPDIIISPKSYLYSIRVLLI